MLKRRWHATLAVKPETMNDLEAALARCSRDSNGLLKLGGLWADPRKAHNHLNQTVRRAGLTDQVTILRAKGIFAPEQVARQLAGLIPPEHLWRESEVKVDKESADRRTQESIGVTPVSQASVLTVPTPTTPLFVPLQPLVNLLELEHPVKQRLVIRDDVRNFIVKYPAFKACVCRPTSLKPGYITSERDSIEFIRLLKTRGKIAASFSVQPIQASPGSSGPSDAKSEEDESEPQETADPPLAEVIDEVANIQSSFINSTLECTAVSRLFGEVSIERRASDGYFNATSMCACFGKHFADFMRVERTKKYIDALVDSLHAGEVSSESSMDLPPTLRNRNVDFEKVRASLVKIQNGGPKRGSWVHELVAVDLARWLSPDFAIWMDGWVHEKSPTDDVEAPRVQEALETIPEEQIRPIETNAVDVHPLASRAYNGLVIQRRSSDGYFNATSMCQCFKKNFKFYLQNDKVQLYLDSLAMNMCESKVGIPTLDFNEVRASLVQVQHGGANRGSWIHERVAVDLARWLSPDFAVWMDGWVLEALGLSSRLSTPTPQAAPPIAEQGFVPRKPLVIHEEDSVGLPGNDHLYAALRVGENLIKIGISKDVLQRRRELAQSFGGQYELLAIWPNEAALESLVLEILKTAKASVGSSREHFNANASFEQICQVVVAARNLYRMNMDLEANGVKRKREDAEFQEDLADRALKRMQQEVQMRQQEVQMRQQEVQMRQQEEQMSLLLELVRQGDDQAKRVFLASLETKK